MLFLIFATLGVIHFNWTLGGEWGINYALPTDRDGKRIITPGKFDSTMVGLGLTCCGIFYLIKPGLVEIAPPAWIMVYASWGIPSIFIFRAIGEFKYVGFFKKVKHTPFGKKDTRIYSPLCLGIAIIGFLIALF